MRLLTPQAEAERFQLKMLSIKPFDRLRALTLVVLILTIDEKSLKTLSRA